MMEIDLRAIAIVGAVITGLVAGLGSTIPIWFGAANIWFLLGLNRIWGTGAGSMLLFLIALYPVWLLGLWAVQRTLTQLDYSIRSLVVILMAVLPLPSIFMMYLWS
jgi:hypothetical protein